MGDRLRVVVFGAGSIGCYLGGRLAAAGAAVTLIGRERLGRELKAHGLHLTDLHGGDRRVGSHDFEFRTDIDGCRDLVSGADLVIVSVKSADTRAAGEALASSLRPDTVVLSAQNGIGNADVLREVSNHRTVSALMVPFNVIRRGNGTFHQGSDGQLEAPATPALGTVAELFAEAGLPVRERPDFEQVQWAKLLLNLNNPINALSGLPLRDELAARPYRQALALAQTEALGLLRLAGVRPARLTPLPAGWIPRLLGVPDAVFKVLGSKMLAIDPLARSSMWEDLEAGRRTEVDWISGEVVALADRMGASAPVNARLVELIRTAEAGGDRHIAGESLLEDLRSQRAHRKPAG